MNEYIVKALPLFDSDVYEAVNYIANTLKNPQAAANLADSIETAIKKRLNAPASFEPVVFPEIDQVYYRIYVGNYIIYYVVYDNVVELHRMIYSARNIGKAFSNESI